MKKILSLALAALMLVSAVPMVYAADWVCPFCDSAINSGLCFECMEGSVCNKCAKCTICDAAELTPATNDHSQGTQVIYNATASEQYTVTVPAQLAPGGSGDVVAQGTWGSDRKLVVTADETVTLANSINANDTKILDIGFAGIELAGSNTTAVSDTKAVSVADIENALFGTWSGTFYYDVELVDNVQLITFNIDSKEYQAEEGMTWAEWCDSAYNTNGYYVSADGHVTNDDVTSVSTQPNAQIAAGYKYREKDIL